MSFVHNTEIPVGHLGFPDVTPEFFAAHHPSKFIEKMFDWQNRPSVLGLDDDIFKRIDCSVSVLVDRFNEKVFASQGVRSALQMNKARFGAWFLYHANKHGEQRAIEMIETFISAESVQLEYSAHLVGINYQRHEFQVQCCGCEIKFWDGLNCANEVTLDSRIVFPSVRADTGQYTTHAATWHCLCRVSDIHLELSNRCETENWKKAEQVLKIFSQSCTLASSASVGIHFLTLTLKELPHLFIFNQKFFGRQFRLPTVAGDGFPIDLDCLQAIEQISDLVAQLSKEKYDRFSLAISQLMFAKGEPRLEERFLYSASALECLVSPDSGEIAFKIAIVGALLLGGSHEERQDVYKSLKRIYEYRSKAVHTGKIRQRKGESIDPVKLSSSFIIKYVEREMPDIVDVVLTS